MTGEVENGFLSLVVEDNGVGIAEDDLAHVGGPFFQVRTAMTARMTDRARASRSSRG